MINNTATRQPGNRTYSHAEQLSVFHRELRDVDSFFIGPAANTTEQRTARDYLAPAGRREYSPQREVYKTVN